jgi:hypothetical protein
MAFARIEDHAITLAPEEIDGVKNPPEEVYIAHGWYPVTYTEPPNYLHRYDSDWEQVGNDIIMTWKVVDDIDEAEAYDIIFGGAE